MLVGGFAFLLMGLMLGLLGGGGAILTVPILVYLFKLDPLQATSSSLFIVGCTAVVGGFQYFLNKQVHLKTVVLFALPSFLGVFISRKIVLPAMPDVIQLTQSMGLPKSILVMTSFAVVMLLASIKMIRPSPKQKDVKATTDTDLQEAPLVAAFRILANGLFVGMVAGFVGAGGGFLIIPALTLILGLPMRVAVGSSLVIIAIQSVLGFLVSTELSQVDWHFLFTQIAISTVGILIGGALNKHISEKRLKTAFGYFVLFMGTLIVIDQVIKLS